MGGGSEGGSECWGWWRRRGGDAVPETRYWSSDRRFNRFSNNGGVRSFSRDSRAYSRNRDMAWGDGHRLDSASRRRQHALGLVRTRSLEREEGSGRFGEFRQANEFRRHSGHRKNTQAADDVVGSTLKRVAKFDRNAPGAERRTEEVQPVLPNGVMTRKADSQPPVRQAAANGGKSKLKDVVGTRDETKEGPEVLVGDVVLKLGNQKGRIALNEGLHYEQTRKSQVAPAASVQGKESSILESSQTDEEVGQGDQEVRHNVDLLVEKITDVEEDDEGAGVKTPIFGEATAGVCEEDDGRNAEVHSPVRMADLLPLGEGSPAGFSVVGLDDTLEAPGSQASWLPQDQSSDQWQWQPDPDMGYTVRVVSLVLSFDRVASSFVLATSEKTLRRTEKLEATVVGIGEEALEAIGRISEQTRVSFAVLLTEVKNHSTRPLILLKEVMRVGYITCNRINGLVDGVSGSW
ncbi:hypothetical protein P8452_39823 [Trifolium repens]|nr:hypothetical protein P8452_39823 [Trifolium repens]